MNSKMSSGAESSSNDVNRTPEASTNTEKAAAAARPIKTSGAKAPNKRSVNGTAASRLRQDYIRLMKDPVPYIRASPLPTNILEWHYVVQGPEDSVYSGGYYHGKLIFPAEYPFKPPSILMCTPNGRFKTNTRLCLSISDFHPDTWNPAWSVSTILTGLLSFMLETSPTLGSIETSEQTKRQLAVQSLEFNLNEPIFQEVFPDLYKKIQEMLRQRDEELQRALASRQNGGGNRNSDQNGGRIVSGNMEQNGMGRNGEGDWGGTLMNLGVILGFTAFSLVVKYIWKLVVNEQL